jgi:putative transposase
MHFEKGNLYHIYNQGNNRQKIFFSRENYIFFLQKIKTHILPFADILAFCLMPNHFHLMVEVNEVEVGVGIKTGGATQSRTPSFNTFQKSIGILLASYTRAINKQNNSTGSLFRAKTKAECLNLFKPIAPAYFNTSSGTIINIEKPEFQYPLVCFNYIHQNPVKANMVKEPAAWEFSSARDYAGLRESGIVNLEKARELGLVNE